MAEKIGFSLLAGLGSKQDDSPNHLEKLMTNEEYKKFKSIANKRDQEEWDGEWWVPERQDPGIDPYVERERKDGEGPLRINTQLPLKEDMYNLCFVAQVKEMYKNNCDSKGEE